MTSGAEHVLDGLMQFQRDAVAHVMRRFHEDEPRARRFLIADETGLGKSIVARGLVAETIERLQHDDSVERIDVVYVCSNADLARQNLARLNVTGSSEVAFTSRLSLLALQAARLTGPAADGRKRVNLISFTPGTSFDLKGWRTGSKEERALIHSLLLPEGGADAERERASLRLFRGTVRTIDGFASVVDWTRRSLAASGDAVIMDAFRDGIRARGLVDEYEALLAAIDDDRLSPELASRAWHLTGALRTELAKASVASLEPDLVILDEFQRFRHLLDPDGGEAAEIAHHLFEFEAAKVVLLSATPYKPFTRAGDEGDDDHFADLVATLEFLAGGPAGAAPLLEAFAAYRAAVLSGGEATPEAEHLRLQLLGVMTRTERPKTPTVEDGREVIACAPPRPEDLLAFRRLQRLAEVLRVPIPIEYWKSIPYFGSFLDGYAVERALRQALEDPDRAGQVQELLSDLPAVDADAVRTYARLEPGSAPMRTLMNQTVGAGLWQLLWLPPSMPYLAPRGPFRKVEAAAMTKRVVFSSWSATPVAVSTILSHEADRLAVQDREGWTNTPEARRSVRSRLAWAVQGDRAAAMSTLALFWPHPVLAATADPLRLTRAHGHLIPPATAEAAVRDALGCTSAAGERDQAWESYFRRPDRIRSGARLNDLVDALSGNGPDDGPETAEDESANPSTGLRRHVEVAIAIEDEEGERCHEDVSLLALHGPGNIAWRALGRLRGDATAVTELGHWRAAGIVANALRSLFGRVETMLLLDHLYGTPAVEGEQDGDVDRELETYWRRVLRYCSDGNLQAVLDEYAYQLHSELGGRPADDALLETVARRMAAAITLRPATYRLRNTKGGDPIAMTTRFAVQYGGTRQDAEASRQPEVRNAFNSPFQPFVLASTSVGQEGIDFHWWSHAVVHWNLPPNPVDFEQREGRVDRYGNHAVRKNVARRHFHDVLQSDSPNPWAHAFAAARDTHPELGEFAPFWVYPGPATVERHVPLYPLSRDHEKYRRLKRDLSLYRLTLGQPRQEDMIELLERRGVDADTVTALDLRPPAAPARRPEAVPTELSPSS